MTIHMTVRSELTETASARGWARRSFGVGYSTDEFTRDDDTVTVEFDPHDYNNARAVVINGNAISSYRDFHQRAALDLLRADRHVRKLRNRERKAFANDDDPDVDPVPHEILDQAFDFGEDVTGTGVRVGAFDGGYTVWWTDYVANDWCEWFPTVSAALARVAQICFCGEQAWDRGFDEPADAFNRTAQAFHLRSTVQSFH